MNYSTKCTNKVTWAMPWHCLCWWQCVIVAVQFTRLPNPVSLHLPSSSKTRWKIWQSGWRAAEERSRFQSYGEKTEGPIFNRKLALWPGEKAWVLITIPLCHWIMHPIIWMTSIKCIIITRLESVHRWVQAHFWRCRTLEPPDVAVFWSQSHCNREMMNKTHVSGELSPFLSLLITKTNSICVTYLLRNSPKKDPNVIKRKSTMTRRYKACPTMDSQHCREHNRWVTLWNFYWLYIIRQWSVINIKHTENFITTTFIQ